jgi:hypothetical protein
LPTSTLSTCQRSAYSAAISAAGNAAWPGRVVSTRMVEVFVRPRAVRVTTVNWTSRAMVSGRRGASGSPMSRRRLLSIPFDSCNMTSSDPSGRVFSIRNGTDLAPLFTRQHRCTPVAENRIQRSL